MKFTASTQDLQKALNKLGGVIPAKSTLPILENILFDLLNNTLTLTATDMDISLTMSFTVKGEEDGKIAVPAKRLMDTIRALDEKSSPVFVADITTNKIVITTDNGQYSLTGESAKEFPAIPQFKATDEMKMPVGTLRKIVGRTSFAVSTDELRPAMMGVLFQSKVSDLRAVATDGHRLVKVNYKLETSGGFKKDIIIPAKALNVVAKSIESGDISIALSDTHIRFGFDAITLISRLVDETYPNYESVIPSDNDRTLKLDRNALIASIRRVSLYSNATTHQVRFDIGNSAIAISAQDLDFGGEAKESISCDFKGDKLEIGFNSNYVIDMLTHLDTEKVTFRFSSPTRAGIISPDGGNENEDITMLVMPVRLTS
jgi:DNA polymerase III subunit beta